MVPELPEAMVVWAGEQSRRLLQHMDLTCTGCALLYYPESARGSEQRPRNIPILSITPCCSQSCLAWCLVALGWHVYCRDMWQNCLPQMGCTSLPLVSLLALPLSPVVNEISLAHSAILEIIDVNDVTCQV